jgi:hypothetical protein
LDTPPVYRLGADRADFRGPSEKALKHRAFKDCHK